MVFFCLECGEKLSGKYMEIGYCPDCDAKIENDMRILQESAEDNFAYIEEYSR